MSNIFNLFYKQKYEKTISELYKFKHDLKKIFSAMLLSQSELFVSLYKNIGILNANVDII